MGLVLLLMLKVKLRLKRSELIFAGSFFCVVVGISGLEVTKWSKLVRDPNYRIKAQLAAAPTSLYGLGKNEAVMVIDHNRI